MTKPRTVIGLSGVGSHDSAVAIVSDGKLIVAAEQERFDRVKHSGALPRQAVDECLRFAGLNSRDIDAVVYAFKPELRWRNALDFNLETSADRIKAAFAAGTLDWANVFSRALSIERAIGHSWDSGSQWCLDTFGLRLQTCPHHLAHAACGWLTSPFDEATIVVIDLIGEWNTTSVFRGDQCGIHEVSTTPYPDSIGQLYATFTQYLGFATNADEYKVMGLAAYGTERYHDFFLKLVECHPDGRFSINRELLPFTRGIYPGWGSGVAAEVGPPRTPGEELTARHADIASALQSVTEKLIKHVVSGAVAATRVKNVVLVGGVALNCVANQCVTALDSVDSVFVPPAPHDAGCALGAALLWGGAHRTAASSFLGPSWDSASALLAAGERGLQVSSVGTHEVGALLAEGKILGLFRGRMEFGPRALGHRSILASPVDAAMRDRLNASVKYREAFRPFAPIVRLDDVHRYFRDAGPSPFMSRTFDANDLVRKRAPAVVHHNGKARLQTISRNVDPFLWELLGRFGERTGVPILVNTSLNIHGEPMVCTPVEAVDVLARSEMDGLVIDEKWLVKR